VVVRDIIFRLLQERDLVITDTIVFLENPLKTENTFEVENSFEAENLLEAENPLETQKPFKVENPFEAENPCTGRIEKPSVVSIEGTAVASGCIIFIRWAEPRLS
jgi:hypothetical protein